MTLIELEQLSSQAMSSDATIRKFKRYRLKDLVKSGAFLFALLFVLVVVNPGEYIYSSAKTKQSLTKNITIGVYYETKCGDSKVFLTKQIRQAYDTFDEANLKIVLVPFGKAQYQYNSLAKSWNFNSQHGNDETYGNKIHNCLIHFRPEFKDHFPFIECTMSSSNENINHKLNKCRYLIENSLFEQMLSCERHDTLGNQLLYESALRTHKLQPELDYVPWIVVDGNHDAKMQNDAEKDLVKFIKCYQFKDEEKPSECQ